MKIEDLKNEANVAEVKEAKKDRKKDKKESFDRPFELPLFEIASLDPEVKKMFKIA